MRKYGIENFHIETIEEVSNQELNDRERYWIDFYKSNRNENGYNLTLGGDGNNIIDTCVIERMKELWNDGLTITEISKELSVYIATVKNYLETHCETYSKEEQKKRGLSRNSKKHSKKVLQFDLDGNYIASYDGLFEASKHLGIYEQRIKKCCNKQIPNVSTYQFIFEGDEYPKKCENPIFIHKPVCQKDLDGNIVAMYISASEAARRLNVNSSCIRRCCYKEKNLCKGYTWDFVHELEYIEYIQKT